MNTKLSTNRKLKRMLAHILSIAVILALAFPAMGNVSAQEESPWLRAFPDQDFVDGSNWPAGQAVHLDITDQGFDAIANENGEVVFDLAGYDLERGHTLTMSSGDIFVTYTARQLFVEDISVDTQTISGTVDGQQTIHFWVGDAIDEYVDTDADGNWSVDLSNYEEAVLTPGTCGNAEAWGDDASSSSTIIDWCVPEPPPNPHFTVFPEWEWFDGLDWPDGAIVSISVEAKPECSLERESWGGFFNGNFPEGCNVEAGDMVTFDDDTTNRWHVVRNLYVTDVDTNENTVTGKVDTGETVYVWPHDGWFEPLQTIVDGSGVWQVDFDDVGYDIQDGSEGRSEIRDGMGNATASDWHVTHPRFTVFPEWEWFDGNDWPNEAMVNITVEGKPECETVKESWGYFFNGSFGEGCDLEIGDTVTFTDRETIQIHTVQNLTVTKANHDDDTIKGIADPGAEVYVWPHATGEQQLAVAKTKGAADGKWNVDFSGTYDLGPGDCGRSEIRDEFANSTAVDWCISNPRIVASASGDWFWTTEFKPGDLDISIYDSPDVGANLLWSGQQVADEWGFIFVGSDIHGQDLVPGNYLVVSDGDSQKSLVLQPISVIMFDTQYDFMAGFAPAGSEVWAAAGPQDWQERIMVEADPITGEWFANFAEIGFDITEDMQPWSYVHIYDDDGDANEGNVPPLELWVAAFTYDLPAGSFTDNGIYPYHFEVEWSFPEPGAFSGQEGELVISGDAPIYDGYVLLRGPFELRGVDHPEGLYCEEVGEVNPNQPMRFLLGWLPADYGMTYQEAQTIFENLTGRVVWDDGMSAELTRHEIIPFSFEDLDAWFNYVCSFTTKLILDANQSDWVDSGITVSAGQSFTIEASGLMNPCSDTYPNGSEICIFYTPVGGEWAVPYENEFGIFPGPSLPFMALLGRIGDGEPFYVGTGGTFTAEQPGTLWFTPNDNLRTDDQGAYSLLVWLEP